MFWEVKKPDTCLPCPRQLGWVYKAEAWPVGLSQLGSWVSGKQQEQLQIHFSGCGSILSPEVSVGIQYLGSEAIGQPGQFCDQAMTNLDNALVQIREKHPSRWTQALGCTGW